MMRPPNASCSAPLASMRARRDRPGPATRGNVSAQRVAAATTQRPRSRYICKIRRCYLGGCQESMPVPHGPVTKCRPPNAPHCPVSTGRITGEVRHHVMASRLTAAKRSTMGCSSQLQFDVIAMRGHVANGRTNSDSRHATVDCRRPLKRNLRQVLGPVAPRRRSIIRAAAPRRPRLEGSGTIVSVPGVLAALVPSKLVSASSTSATARTH